jgi:hypothetical protein
MGNHRSGTTWLHLLLAETGCFAYVMAFHVIAYRTLDQEPVDVAHSPAYQSLVDTFTRLGLDHRVVDDVAVSPSSPEEYGSILVVHSSLNAVRAVLANKDPYYALLAHGYDRLFTRPAQLYLLRLLSARRFDIGVRSAIHYIARANGYFVTNIRKLPPNDYLSIRYEDLCSRTPSVLAEVLQFCDVDPMPGSPARTPPRPRLGTLLPEVARHADTIARRMAPYMRLHGYRPGGGVLPLAPRCASHSATSLPL